MIKVITGLAISKSRVNDTRHHRILLPQCHNICKSDHYVTDRRFDSKVIQAAITLLRQCVHGDGLINHSLATGAIMRAVAGFFPGTRPSGR